jgi:hypothetical protein
LQPVGTAGVGCDAVDDAEDEDAFNRAGHDAERECVGMVFVPCLDVEGEEA